MTAKTNLIEDPNNIRSHPKTAEKRPKICNEAPCKLGANVNMQILVELENFIRKTLFTYLSFDKEKEQDRVK